MVTLCMILVITMILELDWSYGLWPVHRSTVIFVSSFGLANLHSEQLFIVYRDYYGEYNSGPMGRCCFATICLLLIPFVDLRSPGAPISRSFFQMLQLTGQRLRKKDQRLKDRPATVSDTSVTHIGFAGFGPVRWTVSACTDVAFSEETKAASPSVGYQLFGVAFWRALTNRILSSSPWVKV